MAVGGGSVLQGSSGQGGPFGEPDEFRPEPGTGGPLAGVRGSRLRTATCRPLPAAPLTVTSVAVPGACLLMLVRASWTIR